MRIVSGRAAAKLIDELALRSAHLNTVEPRVRAIVNDVRQHGDRALRKYAEKWDGLDARSPVRVSQSEMAQCWEHACAKFAQFAEVGGSEYTAILRTAETAILESKLDGVSLGQLVRPLDSVGCYVPGGRYPLLSTVLMTVIPAQVAGVKRYGSSRHDRRRRSWAQRRCWEFRSFIELEAPRQSQRWPMERRACRA